MRFNLLVVFLLTTVASYGQQDSLALSEEYYRMGMEIFDYEHRKQASEMFILSTQANPKNAKAYFMAGQSIMLSLKKGNSLPYFKKAYTLDPKVDADILFQIGKAYHYAEHFDSALHFYNRYYRQLSRSTSTNKSKRVDELNRKISECYNARLMMDYPVTVTITNMGDKINSEYPDYAPAIDAEDDFMIFTTRRPEDNKSAQVAKDHEYYEDIFYSTKEKGEWTQTKSMTGPLNTSYHNASISISPDGNEILLYSDLNGGDIFVTYKQADGTWTRPVEMEGINTPSIENSASLTADRNTLYFTSNRPGGLGGTDIYMCTKDSKGRWTNPQNLGNLVNTELDEEAVFISANGKHLYFSSNGHIGMGDLDIYRSAYNEEKQIWEKPINMGYPINSVENDIYFVLSGNEGIAYFSSVREPSIGEEDIYKLDISKWKPAPYTDDNFEDVVMDEKDLILTDPVKTVNTLSKETNTKAVASTSALVSSSPETIIRLNIHVAEGSSYKPLHATVTLSQQGSNEEKTFKEINTGNYYGEVKTTEGIGQRYKLHISSQDYLPYSSNYYFLGGAMTQTVITDTVYLDKMSVNYNRILNVYFDINSDVPKTLDDVRYLEQLMKTSPSMKVEISGHTDNTGTPEYNVGLSKRRSEAVKKYLVSSGIDASRITALGYGAEKPIADNVNRDGRRLNRRTEFTIIEK